VELEGEVVARIDGEPLFAWADAASCSERPQFPHLFDPCRVQKLVTVGHASR
jgi:hypothetical protein